jgi:hypothetical protein
MPRHNAAPHTMMILVCHAADGYFADGDRQAVQWVLDHSERIGNALRLGPDRYTVTCADGGCLELRAPGLAGSTPRSFHRMELFLGSQEWTMDMLNLVFDLMQAGGFGLVDNLEVPQFIVTQPQQVSYFPWLPEPPLLVRNSHDLGLFIGQA